MALVAIKNLNARGGGNAVSTKRGIITLSDSGVFKLGWSRLDDLLLVKSGLALKEGGFGVVRAGL